MYLQGTAHPIFQDPEAPQAWAQLFRDPRPCHCAVSQDAHSLLTCLPFYPLQVREPSDPGLVFSGLLVGTEDYYNKFITYEHLYSSLKIYANCMFFIVQGLREQPHYGALLFKHLFFADCFLIVCVK